MTVINNVGNYNLKNQPTVVTNVPNNIKKLNFKANDDKFVRQPSVLDQQAALRKALEEQQKAQKTQKIKNTAMTILSVAVSVTMLGYFGYLLRSEHLKRKAEKEAAEAMKELMEVGLKGADGAGTKIGSSIKEVVENCKNPKIKKAIIDEMGSNTPSQKKIAGLQKFDSIKDEKLKIVDIERARKILDDEVIGEAMEPVKEEILKFLRYRNRCIKENIPIDKPFVLALDGPAGTAKTRLTAAIAKACDMPYKEINCAGATGKHVLAGGDTMYQGSSWGQVADAQIEHGTKQIVYAFDELEKSGSSDHNGRFLDTAVSIFDDRHRIDDDFLSIPIDVKDSILVITTNDFKKLGELYESRVGSYLYKIPEYTIKDKIAVGKFKMDKFLDFHKLKGSVKVTDDAYELIANNVTDLGGRQMSNNSDLLVRAVIDLIEQGKINPTAEKPFVITTDIAKQILRIK